MSTIFKSDNFLLTLFLLTGSSSLFAQQVQLKGTVIDSTQNPIPYTNLIASPLAENQDITFALQITKALSYKS